MHKPEFVHVLENHVIEVHLDEDFSLNDYVDGMELSDDELAKMREDYEYGAFSFK